MVLYNMNNKFKRNRYPLLGEPRKMFADDNVYVVDERAELGKAYSFVCPHCHAHFVSQVLSNEVQRIKCPDCETYICFSTSGREGIPTRMRTQVITKTISPTPSGVLVWKEDGRSCRFPLKSGNIVIGRKDNTEPSDISLNDATASRQSVRIDVTKGSQTGRHVFKLTVLRTTNAVYVNHNALFTKSSIYLNYGDTIKVGETVLRLIAEE